MECYVTVRESIRAQVDFTLKKDAESDSRALSAYLQEAREVDPERRAENEAKKRALVARVIELFGPDDSEGLEHGPI
jgi:hypothetical protein